MLIILGRSILEGQVASSLTNDASLQVTIAHVYGISTAILKDVAGAVVFISIILVAAAWFAGPARPAYVARQAIAPFLRDQAVATYGMVLAILVLLFIWNPIPATGKPLGILVFTLLALLGTYVLIQQTAREFPEARSGAATHAIRTRVADARERRQQSRSGTPPAGATLADQLKQLAELRDSGSITTDEYDAAKARLLGG